LGTSLKAHVALIVTCHACLHQATPDLAEQVARHGADLSLIDWAKRLVCSKCGGREVDFVVAGYSPPHAVEVR
jgi:hypothetical protein